MQLYSEILDAGGPAFGSILRHVRDSPNDGFLFHCTGALPTLSSTPLITACSINHSREGSHGDSGCSALIGGCLGLVSLPMLNVAQTSLARWR